VLRLPKHRLRRLWLAVIKGIGERPLMFLTTEPLRRSRKVLLGFVKAYLTRWRVEDTIGFIKPSYNLEDVRVKTPMNV